MLLTGDMSYWFESSPCERMVCRRVKFVGERAGVQAVPQFLPTDKAPYYHGDLVSRTARSTVAKVVAWST